MTGSRSGFEDVMTTKGRDDDDRVKLLRAAVADARGFVNKGLDGVGR